MNDDSSNSQSKKPTAEALEAYIRELTEAKKKKSRCWKGYEPVPGKEPYSKGSCKKISESIENDPPETFVKSLVRNGHEVVLRQQGSRLDSPIAVYINGKKQGVFPHKAAAIEHAAKATKSPKDISESLARQRIARFHALDLGCDDCDHRGHRHTDDDLHPDHKSRRNEEFMALHRSSHRTSKQQNRYERLSHLRQRDNRHDFEERQSRRPLRENVILERYLEIVKTLLTEEDFKTFEKLAKKYYKKRKTLGDARKNGETGLQDLGAEVDELKRQIASHPVNRVEFWRKNPKLVSKLEKAANK